MINAEDSEEETIRRLEGLLIGWHINVAINIKDDRRIPSQCEYNMLHIIDELEYWKERLEDLEFIIAITKNEEVVTMMNHLRTYQSGFEQLFDDMIDRLEEAIIEATSNMNYLQILKQPSMELYDVMSLDNIMFLLPDLFFKIIYIYDTSPYYNKSFNFNNLCDYLSNQVIFLCRNTIDTAIVLDADVQLILNLVHKCLECCEIFLTQFNEVVVLFNSQNENHVVLKAQNLHSFIRRCQDLKYILKSKIVFNRINVKHLDIPKPKFTFAPGAFYEESIENNEHHFNIIVNNLRTPLLHIFNLENTDWIYHMNIFQDQLKDLCLQIEKLIEMAMNTVCNSLDRMNILQSLLYFSEWPPLEFFFRKKTGELYYYLIKRVELAIERFSAKKHRIYSLLPKYSGIGLLATTNHKRISSLKNIIASRPWLMASPIANQFSKIYVLYKNAYRKLIIDIFQLWSKQIDPKIEEQLQKHIMIAQQLPCGYWTFTVNIADDIYTMMREIKYWNLIGKELHPTLYTDFVKHIFNMKLVRKLTQTAVKTYNSIVAGLSKQEQLLFYPTILACVKQMQPLFTKFIWAQSKQVIKYISTCFDALEFVQETEDNFKYSNIEIVKLCEKIANTPLVKKKLTFEMIHNFDNYSNNISNNAMMMIKIINIYNEIIRYVTVIYEGFEKHIKHMKSSWETYVEKIDFLINESLILNVRYSLNNILLQRHYPIFLINVSLDGKQMKYNPSLLQLTIYSARSHLDMALAIKAIPRLTHTFKINNTHLMSYSYAIAHDKICCNLQLSLDKTIQYVLILIKKYMSHLLIYNNIWTIDKREYFKTFKASEPVAEIFDQKLIMYKEYLSSIKELKTEAILASTIIHIDILKSQIIKHCQEWYLNFSQILIDKTDNLIEHFYEYMTLNSARVMTPPKDLIEMVECIEYQKKILLECDEVKENITLISDNVRVLNKHNIQMSENIYNMYKNMNEEWKAYMNLLIQAELMLKEKQDKFQVMLLEDLEKFKEDAKDFVKLWEEYKETASKNEELTSIVALDDISRMEMKYKQMKIKEKQLESDLAIFNIKYVRPPEFNVKKDMIVFKQIFNLVYEWDTAWNLYKSGNFWEINISSMEITVQRIFKQLNNSLKLLKDESWKIIEIARDSVDAFRRILPLISNLKNPAMRPRHWDEVRKILNKYFDETDENFTLEEIIKMQMQKFEDQINEVSNRATMELNIENALKSIRDIWTNLDLIVDPYDEGIYRIKASDEILQLLEDHLVQLYAIKGSKYCSIFIKEVDYWEKGLSLVMEVLDMTLSVQRQFLYAANIFKGEDIRSKIPTESETFEKLTKEWKKITLKFYKEKNVFKSCNSKSLLKQLILMNEQLGEIQRALELYMETKRNKFPRFYFISNDDLLDILVNANQPLLLQPHFKKCFDNINKIEFSLKDDKSYDARGMHSADGEYVKFTRDVKCEGPVEEWLMDIETTMRETLKDIFKDVMKSLMKHLRSRDEWILKWPGQLCITASQVQWTTNCTLALIQSKKTETRKPLKRIRKKQKKILSKFSDAIRGNLNKIDRLKIVALVTIEIHARDVIDKMYKTNCMDIFDFEWMSQLRFYWHKDKDDIIINQTNTEQSYGYEYLGNSGRLVITPLTDRCYITLTTALHLFRGGSPKGPAGTGKTETVKDLGKNLAYYVIVINCSEGLDYKSMERMFSGLSQQGAWGCFDEFNRINIEVLSVVAQQILSIYTALAAKLTFFKFVNSSINLIPTCGIFITMNPGYAGRTELPDNLKSMFRAISMMVPDSKLIAEITLFGEGFRDTRNLANKVYVLFSLCRQQLSKQDHYEFGLRGLVALLRYSGQCRRLYPNVPDNEVLLLAMHNMNLAKLTVDDLPLFIGITNDLFPKISLPVVKNDILIGAIKQCMLKKNHQPSDSAIAKIVQLYETKVSRHSVMVLGSTGTAKTATWKTLRDAMTLLKQEKVDLFETVIEYPLNPKALTLGELYGEYNLSTQEWMDGVLSSIMRKVCSDNGPEQKWILFDGPVDAVWIENMNSVMDDNKVLTLINSERITMPEQVSLLFEVEDLAVASPATVSRCGIVYNDYKDFGWKLYVNSWLNNYSCKPYKDNIKSNFYKFIDITLEFKKLNCIETVPLPELSSIESLCKLLECFTSQDLAIQIPVGVSNDDYEYIIKIWFLFCMVWSVCAVVNEEGRKKIDIFIRDRERAFPVSDTVYHYYVDTKAGQFRHWDYILQDNQWTYDAQLPFFKIIVPTIDTVRYNYLVEAFMKKNKPVLLVGPVGTGKTSTVQKAVDALDKNIFSFLTINMSAQTTSYNIQETLEGRLEKRTKDLFVPQANKSLVAFLDDMNMPEKEIYGAQPPLELIRQWIDYGFWFDRQTQLLKYVKKILLIGAMGPPGGGRNTISNRLISCFSMINLTFPEEPQITKIYKTMLKEHLVPFEENIRNLSDGLTEISIALYKSVVMTLLPTPAKMHYLFNLRDISKVFQGLLRSNTDYQKTHESMMRLWCNEVFRVFNDKLIDEKDREWFLDQINLQLGKLYDMTFRNLCSSDRTLMFCDFLNKHSLYEEVSDEVYLRKFIENRLDEYNSSTGVIPMNLVLFKDAIDHICRIVRVISQPRGYILLVGIGGSGRSSLGRLSNWLCDYNMFTIELTKTYGTSDFKEDLKSLYYQTGVKDQPTSFLFNDTQVVNETFLEIINNILSTGEVTKLYKDEEFDEIKDTLLDTAKRSGVIETTDAIYAFFLDRVRSNLHIILCFSPIGNKFRMRLRQYPSLINCTTIDWFLDWPKDALLEVAFRSLTTIEILETITGQPRMYDVDTVSLTESELRLYIANLFAIIHHSVVKYSNEMLLELKRYNYVTPTNYLELVSGYKDTLRKKRIEIANSANKLRNGLYKIENTSEKVADMTIDLERATEIVFKYTEECDKFLAVITNQTIIADQQKQEVDEKSIKIKEEEVECQELYSLAKTDLEKALPALDEAMQALNALNKTDLAEVKSFSKPPYRVKLVMEAVMILLKKEPTWTEAKKQLGDPNFLTTLRDFDKDHISEKVLKHIGVFTRNPEFEPEKVGVQSIAAKSLAKWVIAIEKYAQIYKIVAPKKEAADAALLSLEEKQIALAAAEEKLAELQNLLMQLKIDFDVKMIEKEQLVKKANILKRNLERAAALIDGLSGERLRWIETVKQLDIDFDYLPGDCLISIAFVSYMGPFVFKYRDILIKLWTKSIKEMAIPCNPEYEIKEFLSDPAVIRNWSINGLPNDDFSTENGIIISRGSRWPLVIDPQCQALKWIKNMETENNLKIIDFCLPNFMKILELALEEGYPTLLQITSEHLDPAVMPILSKSIIKKGELLYIKMGDKLLPYNENFRFFITTKIRNPYYPPEIFTRATVVNFAIKEEGLEDQLLDVVIRMEKPELKKLKDTLIINIYNGKKTLIELEDELLRLLNEIEGSLLENDELFQTLAYSKITSANVNEQLESSLITQAEINIAREGYRVCAKRASILFFVLNELNLIDPMYQFSLDSYMYLFENSIKKSEPNENLIQRLQNLNSYHTYAVYQNTCRALFEVHKLLFSFQICISLLTAEGYLPQKEIEFLLKGGIVLNRETQTENPCTLWLPSSSWDNITELDKLPGFLGIEKSFEQYSNEWKEWYMAPNPEIINLIGKWNENTNKFQKLLFVRCLRLDRLSFAIANYISDQLGSIFIEPPVLNLKSVLDDSSNKTPLIFLLSPGVDPTSTLINLAINNDKKEGFQSLSLGQGQAPIATKLIKDAQAEGTWVFLANCHLSLSWMPELDKIIDVMQDGKSDPDFRLWLSSNPHPDFPIAILQSAIKMTTEPPKGLKANMKRLYQNITEYQFNKCISTEKYKKLLFALCFFHSILIERKKFQNLGWNVVYSFNDSDFEVSENLLSIYLDEYKETPWNALKYLVAGICYGGHVTDDWDRRLLNTYINHCFNESAIKTPYYRLSSLLNYYIPRDDDLQSYRDFIDTLPFVDSPEVFGQHFNAEMASLMEVNRTVCETLMIFQGQSSSVNEDNKEENVLILSSKILSQLPEQMDYDATVKNIGIKRNPLDVVLLQEIQRYNVLLKAIKISLIDLRKGIKGLVVMSSALEEVFQCVYDGRVPGQWLKAYPSLMTLGTWTQDLIKRVNHFSEWANRMRPPILFWLGAYTYPTGFLTAVLQIHSRSTSIAIDLLNWEFTAINTPNRDIVLQPQEGVYVRNLYLEGANWNYDKSCLSESIPLKFISDLPVMHFKPVQTVSKIKDLYQCPVYYYPQRCGTQGRDAFVVLMTLKSGSESPDYWIKRSTAVLLNLST